MTCGTGVTYATRDTPKIILWDYENAAPRNFGDHRGFATNLYTDDGDGTFTSTYETFLADHNNRAEVAAAYNITLGLIISSPFGRGPNYETLPNGASSTFHLDQLNKAVDAGYDGIEANLIANTNAASTILYLGSIPVMTFAEAGLTDLIAAKYGFAFDAITTYEETSTMFSQAKALADTNPTWAEANKEYKGLPLVGYGTLWDNPKRVTLAQAPAESVWWWRTESNDGAWDINKVKGVLQDGLNLWIRLDQLTEAQQIELYEVVAAFQGRKVNKYCGYNGIISSVPCCDDSFLDGIFFGPFSAGLDVFASGVGAGFYGFGQYNSGSNYQDGDGDLGGGGSGIGDPPDNPFIDGDANTGGPGDDIGDGGGGGGGGGSHDDPPVGGGQGGTIE